ncbi:hypothetical protein RESH_00323 [Rhodopirellula europaea SH398]|uniref:Uncharacterized protein n=1 Tax=Rhodopirellula europaea SH398 TaxID=1263868 RepID=M5SCI1_9BACT|nr:hypothetical protein RESH_00323 [Rhodopirellula europaea SH398]
MKAAPAKLPPSSQTDLQPGPIATCDVLKSHLASVVFWFLIEGLAARFSRRF